MPNDEVSVINLGYYLSGENPKMHVVQSVCSLIPSTPRW
jgi:hypothetical protein